MVFKIVKFDLIGQVLYTKEPMPNIFEKDGKFFDTNGKLAFQSRLWEYSSNPPKDAIDVNNKFMPYFADVTQDINPSYGFPPTTYKNCQLLSNKHNGYLQFFDHATQETHRIAMNSNIYTPITK
jgi:hypothetical protein